MAVREKAKSGYYPIKFKIRYRENENGNFAAPIEDTFYVRVYGKDEDDSLDSEAGENERTKARIIVDSFETDPAEIYAGQDFTLKVQHEKRFQQYRSQQHPVYLRVGNSERQSGIYDGERFKLRGC